MITQKDIGGLFQAVNDMAELRSENKAIKKENEFYKELLTKQLILPVVSGSLLSDKYIDVVFPVSNEWANEDKAHAIGKRQGAKWMRDKLVGNDR